MFSSIKPVACAWAGTVFLAEFVQSGFTAPGFLLAAYVSYLLAVWCFALAFHFQALARSCQTVWENYLGLGLAKLTQLDIWATLRRNAVRAVWNSPLIPFVTSSFLLALLSNETLFSTLQTGFFAWKSKIGKHGMSPLHSHAFVVGVVVRHLVPV